MFILEKICLAYSMNFTYGFSPLCLDTNVDSSGSQTFRSDGRCGSNFPLLNGNPSECDPTSVYFCCSKWGFCGNTDAHCKCPSCVDYTGNSFSFGCHGKPNSIYREDMKNSRVFAEVDSNTRLTITYFWN